MKNLKYVVTLFLMLALLLIIPNVCNAAVDVTKDVYSNNGSMKFSFTGLTLDTTHEYEFGLTKTAAAQVENWYLITEYTDSTAVIDITTTTSKLREVINTVDTGYITIKDKTADTVALQPYAVDLKIPYLMVTNFSVIDNGKEFGSDSYNGIQVALRNPDNSQAYYQYEKITDTNIINKYKEIKANNGDYNELQDMLKTTEPNSNWAKWGYWNGHSSNGMNGYGYTQKTIQVPDTGLYYMWVYFSGNNIKNLYGYILVDNLQPEIALDGISLPKTANVELGKTITLTPTFNPSNATNKIVTWSSSDESVATIDNAGKITPKKVGSTIITITTQDGNKQATCTVTVTEASSNNSNNNTNNGGTNTGSNTGTTVTPGGKDDTTVAPGTLPKTGIGIGIIALIVTLIAGAIIVYSRYNKLRDI